MQIVEHLQWLPYQAETIYTLLTNPDSLALVVGRITQAKIIERHENHGRVAVVLDMPARKVIETIGDVEGFPYEKLSFRTSEPFPLEFEWKFTPHKKEDSAGTDVLSKMGFDLSVLGIPVSGRLVQGILASELKEDMQRLENLLQQKSAT